MQDTEGHNLITFSNTSEPLLAPDLRQLTTTTTTNRAYLSSILVHCTETASFRGRSEWRWM